MAKLKSVGEQEDKKKVIVKVEYPKSKKKEKVKKEKKEIEKKVKEKKKEKDKIKKDIKKNGYKGKKLGSEVIWKVRDKELNGKNYKKVFTYSGQTFLLSEEDLRKQVK